MRRKTYDELRLGNRAAHKHRQYGEYSFRACWWCGLPLYARVPYLLDTSMFEGEPRRVLYLHSECYQPCFEAFERRALGLTPLP